MGKIKFIVFVLLFTACSTKTISISIPSKKSLELEYPNYNSYETKIQNTSSKSIVLKTVDFTTHDSIQKKDLKEKEMTSIYMNQNKKLFFKNESDSIITLKINLKKSTHSKDIPVAIRNASSQNITLFFANGKTIIITPYSNKSYWFFEGQKIYFTEKGERFILFEVNDSETFNAKINLTDLLEKRKKELAL